MIQLAGLWPWTQVADDFGFWLADVGGAGCGDHDVVGYFAGPAIGGQSSGPRSALKRHGRGTAAGWIRGGGVGFLFSNSIQVSACNLWNRVSVAMSMASSDGRYC